MKTFLLSVFFTPRDNALCPVFAGLFHFDDKISHTADARDERLMYNSNG
ncbi:MAG: hypothetical protein IJI50_07645 [Ruminococcus sp.]|nr:hypothetical protein [Ruminococcus sp.]